MLSRFIQLLGMVMIMLLAWVSALYMIRNRQPKSLSAGRAASCHTQVSCSICNGESQ